MKLLKNKKVTFVALLAILAVLSTQSVSAMHIMEGYLPLFWCIFWFAVFLPFFVVGLMRIKKIVAEDPNSKTMLALSGAFIFILSSLKIPSVTGSSSHPTGVGLGTAMFWSIRYQRFGNHLLALPSSSFGSWWLDNSGCQCLLNGRGWSIRWLFRLQVC